MEVNISQYPQLREEQRIEARQRARENLLTKLGGEPQFEDFERRTYSHYGPTVDRALMGAMIMMLVAAFTVSAFHIYHVGNTTYRAGIDSAWQAIISGFALVILAETAVLLLSVMPAVWDIPRGIKAVMYTGAIGAAFIAAIGNIDVTITYTSRPFDWFQAWIRSISVAPSRFVLATMPPALTLIVGQGLKYRVLIEAQRRHEAKANYEAALADWKRVEAHLEQHSDWLQAYATALWDTWRHGKRKEIWQGITASDRRAIVQRELEAEHWFSGVTASQLTDNDGQDRQRRQKKRGVTVVPDIDPDIAELTGKDRVKAYLDRYPEAEKLDIDELAERLAVSGRTVYRGKSELAKNGDFSRNGHKE